ncbi:Mov34/MPN/PAD-1 family protein [Bradyrhizobium elkanii]|uniref:Mov34/MPN/PAD-1 family protein n=2 Tax=Bradyrhizobium elkanii TaxID=29448 RepID=UPI001AE452FF
MPSLPSTMIFRAELRLVAIDASVIGKIERYTRAPENMTEAGGILVGCYRGPHVEITECSEPLRRDRRSRLRFDRDDPGHQDLAKRRWKESGRVLTFVGEWHTHPESLPSPSSIDLNTWREVSRKNAAGSTVFLIRGYHAWWAGLASGRTLTRLSVIEPDAD